MKAQNLIPSVAAILLTFASLSAVNYNVQHHPAPAGSKAGVPGVVELAPVQVRPSAAEMRSAALMNELGAAGIATIPTLRRLEDTGNTEQFSLLGSQLVMPYYAFGNKFGRITKE